MTALYELVPADASLEGTGIDVDSLKYQQVQLRPPAGEFGFAAAVAAFGLLLRNSHFKGTATYDDLLAMARAGRGEDLERERSEFLRMVELARGLELAARE